MRIAIIGAGEIGLRTAEGLIQQEHEVVIIESNKSKIDELSEVLDCSFLLGDGANPAILREVGPDQTEILMCLSDNDQANIIASLIGRSLGFTQVITSIEDPEFEIICNELGLEQVIIPSRTIGRYLIDMTSEIHSVELSTILKGEARFFTLTIGKKASLSLSDLKLPEQARVVCFYREEQYTLPDDHTTFQEGDEVIIITHRKDLPSLQERWTPRHTKDELSA